MRDIFISHVEEDASIATQLADGLESAGYSTWYYERDSYPGPSYLVQILNAVGQARAFLVVVSPSSIASQQVHAELVQAHESARAIVPVLAGLSHQQVRQMRPDWGMIIGASTSVQYTPAGVEAMLARIEHGLREMGVEPGGDPGDVPAARERPYRSSAATRTSAPRARSFRRKPIIAGASIAAIAIAAVMVLVLRPKNGPIHATASSGSDLPSKGTVLMRDAFDGGDAKKFLPEQWDDSRAAVGYAGERIYYVNKNDPQWKGVPVAATATDLSGVMIEVEAFLNENREGFFESLACDYDPRAQTGYRFDVYSKDGTYAIWRMDRTGPVRLGRGASPLIRRGDRESSRLALLCSGGKIEAFVNDTRIHRVSDGTYGSGRVGVGAGSDAPGQPQARFDNLRVCKDACPKPT